MDIKKIKASINNDVNKNLLLNFGILITAIITAIIVFSVFRSISRGKEKNTLIPQAKEAVVKQEYSKAINLYEKAAVEFPDNSSVKKELANLYYSKGKYDESLKYYISIKKQDLDNETYDKIGEVYYDKQDFDNALKTWEGKDLPTKKNYYKLARLYYDKDQLDKYIETLKKVSEYREPLLYLQVTEKDLSKVVTNTDKALTLETLTDDKINTDIFKSQIIESKKQLDLGKKDFSDLINIAAFSNLNQCKFLFDKIAETKKSLEAKKIPVYQVDYYKGVCLNQVNNPTEAIPLIESAIKADPTVIEYREALAKSFFLKNDDENLKKIYNEIIAIQKSPIHYENLAIYQYKLGLLDESLTNYDKAFAEQTSNDLKKPMARTILHINLVDKKNLEICKRKELLDLLNQSDKEGLLIIGICKLNNDNNIDGIKQDDSFSYQYISNLKNKDKKKIEDLLDKDLEGLVTTYHKAVGETILNSKK